MTEDGPGSGTRLTQARLVVTFCALTLAAGWAPFGYALFSHGASLGEFLETREGVAFLAGAVAWLHFPPLLSALYLTGPVLRRAIRPALGLTFGVNRYWGTAWLTPIVVFLVGLGAAALMTGEMPLHDAASYLEWKRSTLPADRFEQMIAQNPPGHPFWLIIRGLPMSITLNLLIALGLESGLRGFLFREMPGGFWGRSLRIGAFAGVYLAPLALAHFPGEPLLGAGLIFVAMLTLSPALVYFRVRADSVVPVALYWSLVITLTRPALEIGAMISPLARPLFGVGGIAAHLALLASLYVHDRYVAEQRLMPERARP